MKLLFGNAILSSIAFLFLISCDDTGKFDTRNDPQDQDDQEQNEEAASCDGSSYDFGTIGCTSSLEDNNLDIVTWNIERFPMSGNTISKVEDIILDLNADVYAIQEIVDIDDFNSLTAMLSGYDGEVVNIGGSLELGFIFKTDDISVTSIVSELNLGITPRDPIAVDIRHSNGLEVKLLNIHLKCCDNEQSDIDQREDASEKLKAYIDSNFPEDEVIILGDWNEDFIEGYDSFINFIEDQENYLFADFPINEGDEEDFSYPSWPSHLDHVLLTNELCDNLIGAYTIKPDDCDANYFAQVSDHRPVMVSLRADD